MKPQDRTRAVLRSGLTPTQKLVLIAICDHMNSADTSFPGMATLSELTGFGRRTVVAAVKACEGRGLVVLRSVGRSSTYRFAPGSLPNQCSKCTSAGDAPVQEMHRGGAGDAQGGVQEMHPKRPVEATIEPDGSSAPSASSSMDKPKQVAGYEQGTDGVLRTEGAPDSVIRIWGEVTQAHGYIGCTITNRKHFAALGSVREQAGPEVLRAAMVAYCDVVKAGSHPWQRDAVPSPGVFVKELPKWVKAGQAPAVDTATRTRALELVDSIKGRIQTHGGSWKRATADLDGEDLEVFARVVCVAGGAEAAWQAWPRLGEMRDWDFGKAIDKARDSAGRM